MKVLYAEDERQLSVAVCEILKMEGYEVDAVYDGAEAWAHLQRGFYDAAILDIMMPKMDGMEVLAQMREKEIYTPVLLLTAKGTAEDRIEGLSVGADDYLPKPFVMKELIARLHSIIRRSVKYRHTVTRCGNIELNCDTGELKSENSSLILSSKEKELLNLLIRQKGEALLPETINEILWKGTQSGQTVTLYISYLKNKLRQIQAEPVICMTDAGYLLKEG